MNSEPTTERMLGKTGAIFVENLKKLMKEKRVSQGKLAQAIGITQPAIANLLERKRHPQAATIRKFAKALGVSETRLLIEQV